MIGEEKIEYMENETIRSRLSLLRAKMKENGIDYYLIPTSDYHNSEYVADFFRVREFFSGFTGSNGTLLVGQNKAGLWTDGRYFVQAANQLEGSGITLYKMMVEGVPTILEFLDAEMNENEVLGFDGMTLAAEIGVEFAARLMSKNVKFKYGLDLADSVWEERPELPANKLFILNNELAGKSYKEKLEDVKKKMRVYGTDSFFISKLDDIMWLTNLRGRDVECNPVALSHMLVTTDRSYLFVQTAALTPEVSSYLKENNITVLEYKDAAANLKGYRPVGDMLFDRNNVSYTLFMILKEITAAAGKKLINRPNPTIMMKAVKNETELKNTREIYIIDSVKLTEFIYWVKKNAGKIPLTETDISDKLDAMRAEIDGFLELSFDTICGYGPNGAIVHYKAKKESAARVEAKGMLLVDSGGNYMRGTTDVTRTMVLGEITQEMKKHFTLVTVGMLRLLNAKFPYGCTGINVDTYAREAIWREGLDFNHGTGHGVGYVLNVHEGPQNIRWRNTNGAGDTVLEEGMLVSDEPGIYIENSHGIRIENILEIIKESEGEFGKFLGFRSLTYAPIDLDGIDALYMRDDDIEALNAYHKDVYETISPYIKEKEISEWLKDACRPIVR